MYLVLYYVIYILLKLYIVLYIFSIYTSLKDQASRLIGPEVQRRLHSVEAHEVALQVEDGLRADAELEDLREDQVQRRVTGGIQQLALQGLLEALRTCYRRKIP